MTDYGVIIRRERPEEYCECENITREAFWNVYRPGCDEHYLLHIYREREDFIPELDLVLEKDGKLIGHVMYVHSEIHTDDGRIVPVMTFGPISILPEYQRMGYGSILLNYSMEKAKKLGAGAIAITGNIAFYSTLGFEPGSKRKIYYAGEPRENETPWFLIKELREGFLDGIIGTFSEPEPYKLDGAAAAEFDKGFTPKERLRKPGQLV